MLSIRTGYVQTLDEAALLAFATERNVVLTVLAIRAISFTGVARFCWSSPVGSAELETCGDYFSIGRKRSALQDLRFPVDELVELAARALSPGVNDPFTAIACIDWLGAALSDLAAMPRRNSTLRDEDGHVRVLVPRLIFADYLHLAVGQLRPYAARDPNAATHLLRSLETVAESVTDPANRTIIERERERLRSQMKTSG